MNDFMMGLNPRQMDAVLSQSKHLLILAGAGSGKTKTITTRIAHLLKNEDISPGQILALTFTNKAAREMKERVFSFIGERPGLLLKTFHSFGATFLRRYAECVERKDNFVIYDDHDSNHLLDLIAANYSVQKSDLKKLKRWVKQYKQSLEDESQLPDDPVFLEIYQEYNKSLINYNAFDFEDLIFQCVRILENNQYVADYYHNRYLHILVDEYQDTNMSQERFLSLLCGDDTSLVVVGDEDQSIYRFRGAEVELILKFPEKYPDTEIVRLEENYRSTENILNAANAVIANNRARLGKTLFSNKGAGSKIRLIRNNDENEEGDYITKEIKACGYDLKDTAVLVRINAQTRAIEESFRRNRIPYLLIGSLSFYEREEVKDVLLLLRWFSNTFDALAFSRFVNKPTRGIGKKSLETFLEFANSQFGGNIYKALNNVDLCGLKGKTLAAFKDLATIFYDFEKQFATSRVQDVFAEYLNKLGIIEYYSNIDKCDGTDRVDNIKEFVNALADVEPGMENITTFLEENALVSQSDKLDEEETVKIMTVHHAKGLEFENVFICGMEQDLFPHATSVMEYCDDEEERRLFYVAITRAKKELYLCYTKSRFLHGHRCINPPSQFLAEIPDELMELIKSNKSDTTTDKFSEFSQGRMVRHRDYGSGRILNVRNNGKYFLATIDFFDYSQADVILNYEAKKMEFIDD
jgi:DNA helicase-2/ATP-dependent DNA helicase PcrA